jgi:hypothetical protein
MTETQKQELQCILSNFETSRGNVVTVVPRWAGRTIVGSDCSPPRAYCPKYDYSLSVGSEELQAVLPDYTLGGSTRVPKP